VLAKSEVIVRHVTIVNVKEGNGPIIIEESGGRSEKARQKAVPGSKAHLRSWWEPILKMKFDDQQQEAPFWLATNNIVLNTPLPRDTNKGISDCCQIADRRLYVRTESCERHSNSEIFET
jgi:hypothetical protein